VEASNHLAADLSLMLRCELPIFILYLFMFGIEFSHVIIAAFRFIRISDRKVGKRKEKKRKEKKFLPSRL
jgi:hypothetical protein